MAIFLYKWLISLNFFTGIFIAHPTTLPPLPQHAQIEFHPFFVSVTEINHNQKDKSLEISSKIFTEDLEATLKQNYKTTIDLTDEKKRVENSTFISDYLNKHLKVLADGKTVKLNYIGYEKDGEAVFCYLEGVNIPSVKKMDIENSILQDFTEQQINIMHVTVNGKRQSYKLDFPQKRASFSF